MPSEIVDKWFNSKKPAQIDNTRLILRESPIVKGKPLSVQQGQAEVFFAKSSNSSKYILKIFHNGKNPNTAYLNKATSILPSHRALHCGTERKILTKNSIRKEPGVYYSNELANYFDGNILMPFISGLDWASVIDQIRNGKRILPKENRLKLCKSLSGVIKLLEDHQISHRDLSVGNVFINPNTVEISLIDFDSMYHPSLSMPKYSAIGTEGYTAPFVDANKATLTHSPLADRFALTMLCVEFLILDSSSPFSHEGGIFKQDEINRRSGKTISYAQDKLKKHYPAMLKLFMRALSSNSFNECPTPSEWLLGKPSVTPEFSVDMLPEISIGTIETKTILFPNNPWENMKGKVNHGTIIQPVFQHHPSVNRNDRPLHLDGTLEVYLHSLQLPVAEKSLGNNRPDLDRIFRNVPAFNLEVLLKKT